MENERKESIKTLECELRSLEKDRNNIVLEYMAAQMNLPTLAVGLIIAGCAGFYFGKTPFMMLFLAAFFLIHVGSVIFHGLKFAKNTDAYEELSREILSVEDELDNILEED